MLFDRGFVSLGDVKTRLKITDTVDDDSLNEIIRSTASTIENAAGRPLRRHHGRTEILSGGSRTIRLSVSPIVKIHHIRESSDRDFDDSTKYTELVEGTDFILEAAEGKRPGESGVIRRLNRNWLGDELDSAGLIRVFYTGGYKTDEEVDLENGTATIQSSAKIFDYLLSKSSGGFFSIGSDISTSITFGKGVFDTFASRAIVRFDLNGVLFPIWTLLSVDLDVYLGASSINCDVFSLPIDGSNSDLSSLYGSMDTGGSALQFDATLQIEPGPSEKNYNINSSADPDSVRDLILLGLAFGHASFGFRLTTESVVSSVALVSSESATSSQIPLLTVVHRKMADDLYVVPGDLRHANALQASYEFQQRKSVGILSSSQRGIAIASGASVSKNTTQILPEVWEIAKRYRRLF